MGLNHVFLELEAITIPSEPMHMLTNVQKFNILHSEITQFSNFLFGRS